MAASTGPIIAAGAIVYGNAVILNNAPVWGREGTLSPTRIVVGAAIAAAGLSLLERAAPQVAVAVAWLALTTVLLVRVDPAQPSPIENFNTWYNGR